ncbi:alpha/beta hydrolase [Actinoplanes sp. NPDC049802]|uniref:alpha/beta fold hydrolase n=1 Tax=Actinoplanes sp. NPDC049802 TaxID=3154742 RepID=UPI0033C3A049
MEHEALGVPVHFAQRGDGMPILVLHGANVDHREMLGSIDPVFGRTHEYRRVYPDLPGMGRTPAPEKLNSSDDVLDLMLAFVDGVIGDESFLVIGHSAGGYFARAITGRRPEQVAGMALICPLGESFQKLPGHQVLHSSADPAEELEPKDAREFRDYFVVQSRETVRQYKKYVVPSQALLDEAGLERMGANWMFSTSPENGSPFPGPALIITGRQDSMVGYAGPWDLLEHYPRATFAVLDRAGHALPHEQPGLVESLIIEWLGRVREFRSGKASVNPRR